MKSFRQHSIHVIILIFIITAHTQTVSAQTRRWVKFRAVWSTDRLDSHRPSEFRHYLPGNRQEESLQEHGCGNHVAHTRPECWFWHLWIYRALRNRYSKLKHYLRRNRLRRSFHSEKYGWGLDVDCAGPLPLARDYDRDQISRGEWFVVLDPHNPDTVWASYYDADWGPSGPWRSTDGGATWRLLSPTGRTSYPVSAIVFDPRDSNTVYVVTNAVYQSNDGGESWKALASASGLVRLAIHPENTNILYGGTYTGALFQSTDRGVTWRQLLQLPSPPQVDVRSIVVDPQSQRTIYVGTGKGFYQITDAGSTWTAVRSASAAGGVTGLVLDPRNPRTMYTGNYGGIVEEYGRRPNLEYGEYRRPTRQSSPEYVSTIIPERFTHLH